VVACVLVMNKTLLNNIRHWSIWHNFSYTCTIA